MRKLTTPLVLLATTLVAAPTFADDQTNNTYNNYGTSNPPMTSTASKDTLSSGLLKDEVIGLKPTAGVFSYVAPNGETQARGMVGLLADINLTRSLPADAQAFYLGISTGAMYGRIGSQTSNFFGTSPVAVASDPGANLLVIPVNLKVGWNIADINSRIGVHGGGNIVYRSIASSLAMGDATFNSGASWRFFPNIGIDFDAGIAKNVSLFLRPDWTFTPGQDLFAGAVGIGFNLG